MNASSMRYIFILMITFFISYQNVYASSVDSTKQNSFSWSIGHIQLKEEQLHSKVFRGIDVGANYTFTQSRKNISEFSIGIDFALSNTSYEKFASAQSIHLKAGYKYLFSAFSNDSFRYFLGPLMDIKYGINAHLNWDESHLYHANFISLGLGNRFHIPIRDIQLKFNFDFPLISAISRPILDRPYKFDDLTFWGVLKNISSQPELSFPNKNFYVKTGIEINFKRKNLKKRSIGYHFQYHRM